MALTVRNKLVTITCPKCEDDDPVQEVIVRGVIVSFGCVRPHFVHEATASVAGFEHVELLPCNHVLDSDEVFGHDDLREFLWESFDDYSSFHTENLFS